MVTPSSVPFAERSVAPLHLAVGRADAVEVVARDHASGIFGLGLGGLERMIVYPVVMWEIALGADLMSGGLSAPASEATVSELARA